MGCGFSRRVVPNTSGAEPGGMGPGENGQISFVSDGVTTTTGADATEIPGLTAKDLSLSFIVPIRDNQDSKEGSLIRRHPPVRLRRLEEEQQVQRHKLTLGALERRQAEAEERRRKILDSRVQSAQHFQRKVQPETGTTTSPSPSPSTNCEQEEDRDKKEPKMDYGKRQEESSS